MANGEVFQAIKMILEKNPEAITESTKYQLILGGIFELFTISKKREQDILDLKGIVTPLLQLHKVLVLIGSIFIATLVAFIWEIITGKIQIVYK